MANDKRTNHIYGSYLNKFEVRDANNRDLKEVYAMVIELAEDLKAKKSESINVSEDLFCRDFQNGYFHLLIVEKKPESCSIERTNNTQNCSYSDLNNTNNQHSSIVGYAIYNFGYDSWTGRILRLVDLYIRISCRKIGLGTYVMATLSKISIDNRCKTFKWQCLDCNSKGLDFYFNKLKATEEVMEQDGVKYKEVNIEMSENEMKDLLAKQIKIP